MPDNRQSPDEIHFHNPAAEGDVLDAGTLQPAIRTMMMPKDTNALGTIFGGVVLSYIDLAGAVEGHRHATGRLVTISMREVVFHAPVHVGDLVSFYTATVRRGRTSVTVKVCVDAERQRKGEGQKVRVTEAELVFVNVDEHGRPVPLKPLPVDG